MYQKIDFFNVPKNRFFDQKIDFSFKLLYLKNGKTSGSNFYKTQNRHYKWHFNVIWSKVEQSMEEIEAFQFKNLKIDQKIDFLP